MATLGGVIDLLEPRLLILETSGRVGQVALALGAHLRRTRQLDETRRHARDLAPAVAELLATENWKPRDLNGVIVSRGPGSYTGLRVGIMAAKVLAYATGVPLIAVESFQAIAAQVQPEVTRLDVLADAQQDKIYVQPFARQGAEAPLLPAAALTIRLFPDWLAERNATAWVSGPGLRRFGSRLPAASRLVPSEHWDPRPESLLHIGLERLRSGRLDDPWTLEPLYLRPSAAEEKWQTRADSAEPKGGKPPNS
jgi:tRNA threonylcarbamoyladenosine biosynthesis protein TsaB